MELGELHTVHSVTVRGDHCVKQAEQRRCLAAFVQLLVGSGAVWRFCIGKMLHDRILARRF